MSYHASIKSIPFEVVYGRSSPMLCTYEKDTSKHKEVEKELIVRDEMLALMNKRVGEGPGKHEEIL